jgi:hypothetical protein
MPSFLVIELLNFTPDDLIDVPDKRDKGGKAVYAEVVPNVADAQAAMKIIADKRQLGGRLVAAQLSAFERSQAAAPPRTFTITPEP